MEKNRWKENYNKAVIRHLYFKPLTASLITFFTVILLMKFILKDLVSAPLVLLAAILYYVYYIDAKIDLLKRKLDRDATHRSSKTLWLEDEQRPDGTNTADPSEQS